MAELIFKYFNNRRGIIVFCEIASSIEETTIQIKLFSIDIFGFPQLQTGSFLIISFISPLSGDQWVSDFVILSFYPATETLPTMNIIKHKIPNFIQILNHDYL